MEPGIRRARPVPLARKLSSNGDDVFKWSSSSSSRSPSNPPKPSDYAEIFGGLAASCSIPVLDLPPAASTEDVFRTTTLDYYDIFGGFETAGFGVSYEELFFPPVDQRVTKQTEVHEQPTAVYESSEKEPKGNRIQLSSSGGRKKSNGSTGEMDMLYQKPSCRTKGSTVDGEIDAKELHAVPEFTFVDDACPPSHITKPDTLLAPVARSLNTTAESSGGVAGSNFRNIEPPTTPCTSTRSCDDLDSVKKFSETKSSPSEDNSANEQYHSCSSGNQSVIDGDDFLPDQSTAYEYSTADTSGGIEETCFGKSALATSSSTSMKSSKEEMRDDQVQRTMKSIASEKIPSFPHLHMHSNSSNNNSASSGDVSILGHLANGLNGGRTFCNQSTNYCSENPEFNTGEVDKKMPNKSLMPKSTNFMLKNAGNGLKEDHKQDNLSHAASEGQPMNSQPHEHTSNNLSASIDDRSTPSNGTKFVTVSDINLQTQPSQVPPPSRPPPRVSNGQGPPKLRKAESMKTYSDKSGYRQATCRRTSSLTGASETLKGTARNGSPPFFDVEVDASSAAAASVAAMKEAMEQAQARLKSAKESMERKKDNLQGRKKSVLTEVSKSKEAKMDETIQAAHLFKQEMVLETDESYRSKRNEFANDRRQKGSGIDMVVSDLEASERYFDLAEESLRRVEGEDTKPSQVSYIQDARAGEWKVEEQFFELVNNSKKPTKVQEFHEREAEKKKAKSHVKSNEEKTDEQTTNFAYELKKNDKSFAVDVGYDFRDRDDTLKESRRVAEVEDKEAPKQIPDVSLQEKEEGIEENSSAQLTEEDKKQQQDHVNVKQKPRTFEDAYMEKESEVRLNEASEVCLSDVFLESGFEELKSNSSKETHLTEKSEESQASKESEQVIKASDKNFVTKPDKSSFISGREPSLENDTGIEEHAASQQKLSEEQSEHGNLTETMNLCEVICNHEEKEPILPEDMMLTKQDEENLSRVQQSCKLTESEKRTNEDCNKEQDERISNAVEESTPWPENNEENETKEGTCWQYFCEKIIRETQEELQQCDEKQTADKADDELNAQGNHEVGMDELEVAPNSQENSGTYVGSQEGCQSVNEMEREDCEQANTLDPPNNVQKAPQMVTERPDSDGNGKNIAEMLNTEERIREERVKIELEQEKERTRKLEEEKEREREREKDRLAFERASREARDRASAEARERAERAAVEKANAEARQRGLAEAREKAERASNEALLLAEKASREARLKAERAAVERATAEARERAVERVLAEKAMKEARERAERSHSTYRDKQRKDLQDFPCEQQRYSDSSNHDRRPEGESAMRCKARLERHQRTVERAAKALAEKNLRDILVQREQAERNRIAETLDADVRRWSNGKEGNLRALLSTLQYILGPESGWQPIPLTGIITAAAVKKAYRKATLCVHPDKLQQRGASIQQKYICEKVFDLLKDAWNRFNSEER